jgi:NTP pyrophosphatase (non-canonical NTP hydrolase)
MTKKCVCGSRALTITWNHWENVPGPNKSGFFVRCAMCRKVKAGPFRLLGLAAEAQDKLTQQGESMNLNPLAGYVFEVIDSKGHHDPEFSKEESITFRQLSHMNIEWVEAFTLFRKIPIARLGPAPAGLVEKMREELADILIVLLDLCAIHRIDLSDVPLEGYPSGIEATMWEDLIIAIGRLADHYRKVRSLNKEFATKTFVLATRLIRRHGSDPIGEILTKMRKNKGRPRQYGLAEGKQ